MLHYNASVDSLVSKKHLVNYLRRENHLLKLKSKDSTTLQTAPHTYPKRDCSVIPLTHLLNPGIKQTPYVLLPKLESYPAVRVAGLDETLVLRQLGEDGVAIPGSHRLVQFLLLAEVLLYLGVGWFSV